VAIDEIKEDVEKLLGKRGDTSWPNGTTAGSNALNNHATW